jgi:thiosulfate/3-mercaptopyruvate sulfurtransferase
MSPYYDTLIDTLTLARHLEDESWIVFDCRFDLSNPEAGRSAYLESHIPGSFYVHLDDDLSGTIQPGKTGRHPLPPPEQLITKLENWGLHNRMQAVVYDQGFGGIAARLWWLLRWLGFSRIAVLRGGWAAWYATFPVESEIPIKRSPGKLEWKKHNECVVDADFVNQVKFDDDYLLIDSRDHVRYLGIEEPIDPIKGHIPGAVSRPFKENLSDEGLWKSKDEIASRFKQKTSFPPEKTIFYCGSGVTACHNVLAYKYAGLGDALLYAGSWSHWITNAQREISTKEVSR